MRALLKKLKAEQSAVDKKEASMYSKVFQRMAQTSGARERKTDQVPLSSPIAVPMSNEDLCYVCHPSSFRHDYNLDLLRVYEIQTYMTVL